MKADEHGIFLNRIAGLGQPGHPHIVIDAGILRQPPATKVADDFADDAGVAPGNES
ncbi:MAG TPA: hypothetical protein VMB80_12345 [Candidatus Acidoferrum sp.]|nr:hypothetical protein [Candidatus Acidoferrum sp.]